MYQKQGTGKTNNIHSCYNPTEMNMVTTTNVTLQNRSPLLPHNAFTSLKVLKLTGQRNEKNLTNRNSKMLSFLKPSERKEDKLILKSL
jgi:hypothetical protein